MGKEVGNLTYFVRSDWERRRSEMLFLTENFVGKTAFLIYLSDSRILLSVPIFFWWTLPLFFWLTRRFPAKSSDLPKGPRTHKAVPHCFSAWLGPKKSLYLRQRLAGPSQSRTSCHILRGAATARARLWRNQMHAIWLWLPGVYPLKAHLVMLGILSRRWYSEFPSSECQYHPNIWSYVSKFHSERGYVWWVPVLVCFSGCFMPLCKSWALYKDHAFFRVPNQWDHKMDKKTEPKKFIRILKSPRDQMAKATSTSWVSVSFTRPSSGAYAFLAKLWHISPRALQTETS